MNIDPVKVSIIICGYNGGNATLIALDSAISQTLKSIEIICVNDASPDNMLEIFQEYAEKDPRVKVISHPVNKGLLAARQTGVNNASGEYIMFLDQDDTLAPEACEELSRKMDETDADMVQFDSQLSYESEEERITRGSIDVDYFSFQDCKTLNSSDEILQACFIDKKFPWNVWSKIYKKDLARKVYSYVPDDMRVVMAEDTFAFFVAASIAEKLVFINKKYYTYSVGVGVSGNTDLKKSENSLELYLRHIKTYADVSDSAMVRKVSDEIGRLFRASVGYKLQTGEFSESYKDIMNRQISTFGSSETAKIFLDNWSTLGSHPIKNVFFGCCPPQINQVAAIRNIDVICTEHKLSHTLLQMINALKESLFNVKLFAPQAAVLYHKKELDGCQIKTLPEDRTFYSAFFRESSKHNNSDISLFYYGNHPDYNLVEYLLFSLRCTAQKPFLIYLEKAVKDFNCHDRLFLGAADCVLGTSAEITPIFGSVGLLTENKITSDSLTEIISLFKQKTSEKELVSAHKIMHATVSDALAELGCSGFSTEPSLECSALEQKIAADGYHISADDYNLIRKSGFFDDGFYKKQFPGENIEDPILHFSKIGVFKLSDTSAIFSTKNYCLANPDLYPVQMNLLTHYLRYGIAENRKKDSAVSDLIYASGYFDEKSYREAHGDELGNSDPLVHYLLIGWKKGYQASDQFVERYYSDCYLGFENNTINPLYHYVFWGKNEGRCAFPLKPRLAYHFPEGYDEKVFRECKEKYLIAIHQMDFTGVPILARMIADIFHEEKNVAIISPDDGPLRESCLKSGIPVIVDSDFFIHTERAAFYKANGFRVCLFNTLGLTKSFLRTAGIIPSMLWIHDNLCKDFLPEYIQQQIQYAPTVFATSKTTTGLVKTYNPGVRNLPYPVKDMGGNFKENVPEKIRFGVFGVYTDRKGQDIAIKAFKALPESLKKKAELLLIGNVVLPEYTEELEAMAQGEGNIRFVPAQKDPLAYHKLYDELEVQICPSRTDPMPLVVFDGMMHGCPEIISDTVGQSDFITDGENGYVFPAGDVDALSACMREIIENPDSFAVLSKNIRQTFLDNFELNKAAESIKKEFNTVKKYF